MTEKLALLYFLNLICRVFDAIYRDHLTPDRQFLHDWIAEIFAFSANLVKIFDRGGNSWYSAMFWRKKHKKRSFRVARGGLSLYSHRASFK